MENCYGGGEDYEKCVWGIVETTDTARCKFLVILRGSLQELSEDPIIRSYSDANHVEQRS